MESNIELMNELRRMGAPIDSSPCILKKSVNDKRTLKLEPPLIKKLNSVACHAVRERYAMKEKRKPQKELKH
jgi:hypothetical protein